MSKNLPKIAKALETSTHPVLFGEDTEPADICQGKVGDCWLVAAIAAVAEFPHYLEDHVFKTKEPYGAITDIFGRKKKDFTVHAFV